MAFPATRLSVVERTRSGDAETRRIALAAIIDARYQSVEAFAADLARFRNQDPVEAHQESWTERAMRIYRRYELPILLLLAYVVMRFVLLIWRGV